MLDPAFGYEATLPPEVAGGPRERAVRAAYRLLWDVAVDGRLVRLGALPPRVRDERLRELTRAFPRLGDAVAATFERLFAGRGLTHRWLLALASGGGIP
jgi:hypothetical protein